jgi:hypothetical protein
MKQLVVDDALGLQWWHLARVRRDEQLRVYVGRGDQGWRPDWGGFRFVARRATGCNRDERQRVD